MTEQLTEICLSRDTVVAGRRLLEGISGAVEALPWVEAEKVKDLIDEFDFLILENLPGGHAGFCAICKTPLGKRDPHSKTPAGLFCPVCTKGKSNA